MSYRLSLDFDKGELVEEAKDTAKEKLIQDVKEMGLDVVVEEGLVTVSSDDLELFGKFIEYVKLNA